MAEQAYEDEPQDQIDGFAVAAAIDAYFEAVREANIGSPTFYDQPRSWSRHLGLVQREATKTWLNAPDSDDTDLILSRDTVTDTLARGVRRRTSVRYTLAIREIGKTLAIQSWVLDPENKIEVRIPSELPMGVFAQKEPDVLTTVAPGFYDECKFILGIVQSSRKLFEAQLGEQRPSPLDQITTQAKVLQFRKRAEQN